MPVLSVYLRCVLSLLISIAVVSSCLGAPSLEIKIAKFPASAAFQLGELEVSKSTEQWIVVTNITDETFTASKVEVDCGCMVGFIENESLNPGDSTRLQIRLKPSAPSSEYRRQVVIVGKNDRHRVTINLSATTKLLVAPTINLLEFKPEHSSYSFRLHTNFDASLDRATLIARDDSRFTWTLNPISSNEAEVLIKHRPSHLETARFRSAEEESYTVKLSDGRNLTLPLRITFEEPTSIRPRRVTSKNSTNENKTFEFFVTGIAQKYFQHDSSAWLILPTTPPTKLEVKSRITGRAVLCRVEVSSQLLMLVDTEQAESELWLALESGEKIFVGQVSLESR